MIRKEFNCEDYDGNKFATVEYFHLSQTDILRLTGKQKKLLKIKSEAEQTDDDDKAINDMLDVLDEIIAKAYCKRDPNDPKKIVKSKELSDAFLESPMHDELVVELFSSDSAMAKFFAGASGSNISEEELLAEVKKEKEKLIGASEVEG